MMVRRAVDADNSCLFSAVAYVMEGSRNRRDDLRQDLALTEWKFEGDNQANLQYNIERGLGAAVAVAPHLGVKHTPAC